VLEIVEKKHGVKHPETIVTYNNLADVYEKLGDHDKAAEFRAKADQAEK
jgi:uncharacterized protein HemY